MFKPGRPPSMRNNTEFAHQCAFFEWLRMSLPMVAGLTFSIPNGGKRSIGEAINLKKSGVLPGVCDVFVSIPSDCYSGLYLEFKSKIGRASALQDAFIARVREAGYRAEIIRDWIDAKDILLDYIKGTNYD